MMFVGHSSMGLTMGTLSAGALSYPELHVPLPVRLLMIPVMGGAALLPDADHEEAKIAHTLGPISKWACGCVNQVAITVYDATRSPKDQVKTNGHRTLSHTALGCVAFGAEHAVVDRVSTWLIPPSVPHWVSVLPAALQMAFLMSLMLWWAKLLRRKSLPAAFWLHRNLLPKFLGGAIINLVRHIPEIYALVSTVGVVWVLATYPQWWWIWPVAIVLGAVVHCIGDGCTVTGVPFVAPFIVIDGYRWYYMRAPLTFHTGKSTETVLVTPALIGLLIASVVLVSGLTPISHYVFPWM